MTEEKIGSDFPTLETDRLILRKVTSEDLKDMHAYGSNNEVSKYVSWTTHQTLSDTQHFLEQILEEYENKTNLFWGIGLKEKQTLIGTINFVTWSRKHKKAEIGYILSQDYWGKGYMTEATKEIIRFGFEEMDLIRIEARCTEENIGSERVMEKVGMSFEGTMRKGMLIKDKHRDIKLYSILST